MRKMITIVATAVLLCAGTYAYADPPNKGRDESRKRWQETEREQLKERREAQREYRKTREEVEREERKRYEENQRESRKHHEEMQREALKHEQEMQRHYFTGDHRTYIEGYYSDLYRKGHCPPGLLKRGGRCVPPGHAKRWEIGRPLPRDVIFHDLPPILIERMGPPPAGHRFVRVAEDILLITTGVGMVVDAIDDLNWQLKR
ncbi:MAG: hypothetical protein M0P57_13500 [Syntrophales bacterium]|jgi:Ni/Co efflux regulator RcnB|nr:hypothetical protein [Syntrophales bacterium]MDY0045270.1 hypothetical protein [Syntrophales bacterium]